MSDWQPETRDDLEELSEDYNPHRYGDTTFFPAVKDRLDNATIEQLTQLARGGIGEPE